MRVRSSRIWLIGVALVLAAATIFVALRKRETPRSTPAGGVQTAPSSRSPSSALSPSQVPEPRIGERILENYGDPSRPPEEDLAGVARTLENFALLVKGDNPLPLGANEEIANALRGKNRAGLRALPDEHPALNAQGQLIDRWGTPLFFHARSRDRLDIRSAGPDRQMWTADDLHRQPNGRFLRGSALLAPSLFEDSNDAR